MTEASGYRFEGGRVLPCEDTSVVSDGVVITEGEHIAWVGPATELPETFAGPEFESIDASGMTVMPGLVDGHMHISFGEAATAATTEIYTPPEYRTIRAAVDFSHADHAAPLAGAREIAFFPPVTGG